VAQMQSLLAQLKTYRQAVLKYAFEGKLTHKDLREGEMPEGWKIIGLGDLTEIITKGASPKWQGIKYSEDKSQVLFITSENVRENFVNLTKEKYVEAKFNEKHKRSILKKGDILLNIIGASIGRAAIFNIEANANINQAVALIRPTPKLNDEYLSYFLNSKQAEKYYNATKVDVARANLSLTDIKNMPIPFCDIQEQKKVIDEIETRLSICDKTEKVIIQEIEKSEVLRQSIFKKAFEGKLVAQEAGDESAGVLLERIQQKKNR
jgi:type I restriction enzyme, S subunit